MAWICPLEIIKLIMVGIFVTLYFTFQYSWLNQASEIFKAPVPESIGEWLSYTIIVASKIALLVTIFYGVGIAFSWTVDKSFSNLLLFAGALSLSLLVISRLLGISGYLVPSRLVDFIIASGLTSWLVLDRLKNMQLIEIRSLILPLEDFINVIIAGIIAMVAVEILLWLNIKKRKISWRLTLPTIPITDVFHVQKR